VYPGMVGTHQENGGPVPSLEIFAQGLVERQDGGWRITDAGRSALDLMESKAAASSTTVAFYGDF
jgi:ribosomal protein S19E (S16A)